MKTIPLTNSNKRAIVDDEDFERVSRFNWYLTPNGYVNRTTHYPPGRQGRSISLPTFVKSSFAPPGFMWDHKNRKRLDNRKKNLRWATNRQNQWNAGWRIGRSGYIGVDWHQNRWRAKIKINKHKIEFLGYFKYRVAAAIAYNEAATRLRGEFARINTELRFPRL